MCLLLIINFLLAPFASAWGGSGEGPSIRYNQIGYTPSQEKIVVIEGTDPAGRLIITTPTGKRVKPKAIRTAMSPWSGKQRYVVDLGPLTTAGRYHISVGHQQCDLLVAERPYHDIATAALRLFYLIRSGIAIDRGGPYDRPLGHPDTHVLVHPSAASPLRPAGTVISAPFGWYDAGDYNKYVVNSSFAIGMMFAAYEHLPDYFATLRTDIPESDNQTPDLLDELMFNLRWLLAMQDPFDGGVYHKLTTPRFEGFIMPADCRQPRYVVAKSVTATLDFAAVMADAARLFEPFQHDYPGFSAEAAAMAERAYRWACRHPDAFYRQQQLTDPPIVTGAYGDRSASDEFFWAATALYRLTRQQEYLDDALRHQPDRFTLPTWAGAAPLGTFEWLAMPADTSASAAALRQSLLQQLLDYCQAAISGVEASSFQSAYGNSPRDFGWGCLGEKCCGQGFVFLLADRLTASTRYRRYALQNADYLLGRNATGYCYVTGFGDKSPLHPHHRISAADTIEKPFPGMLVGGPNPGQQDRIAGNLTYPSNYPDESYLDATESYASNEIAINWNASLVALLCWLDALK
ncbi:MAG: glycoside hydrolase family 9 protein [Bacteroidaceae bacterium]|nr:glycoside hydrolase family 9 protein [Bacteroidaceae bacterium]